MSKNQKQSQSHRTQPDQINANTRTSGLSKLIQQLHLFTVSLRSHSRLYLKFNFSFYSDTLILIFQPPLFPSSSPRKHLISLPSNCIFLYVKPIFLSFPCEGSLILKLWIGPHLEHRNLFSVSNRSGLYRGLRKLSLARHCVPCGCFSPRHRNARRRKVHNGIY